MESVLAWMNSFVAVVLIVLVHPIGASTVGAIAKALRDDWRAFQAFETYGEAKAYRWGVAAWRGFKGAVVGFVTGIGIWLTARGLGALVSQ